MIPRLAVALAALPAIAPLPAMADETVRQIAARVFQPVIEDFDIPGLAVGVTIGGEHHIYTHGVASRETGAPVSADTIFELGSISKLFTVTLAALAEGRGLLSLEEPVSTYRPELSRSVFDRITPINLATHTTGGLPLQVPDRVGSEAGLMHYLSEWWPASAVGRTRSYSNIGIGLLGLIVAERFGTSYARAAQELLFPALGLDSTYIEVPESAAARYAFGHAKGDDRPIRVEPGMLDAEAYGVKSSARDMLRFLDAHLGDAHLGDAHLGDAHLGQAALAPEIRAALDKTRTGYFKTAYYVQNLVWEQYPWPTNLKRLIDGNASEMALEIQPVQQVARPLPPKDTVLLNKTGSTYGFGAYVALLPGEALGIVVLANRNYPNAARVAATYRLIERLLWTTGG